MLISDCRRGANLDACSTSYLNSSPETELLPQELKIQLFKQSHFQHSRHSLGPGFSSCNCVITMVVMKEAGEFIRRGIISRVKSEQAIRRSKRLVQGTKNILETPVPAPEAPAKACAEQQAPRTM